MANMKDPDHAHQMRIANAFLKHHPKVAEAIAAATKIVTKVEFPIPSFQDLVEAMGGPDSTLQFGGRSFTLAELECRIPSYYFPIANENDLVAKIGDLSTRSPVGAVSAPVLIPASASRPDVPPPTMSPSEIYRAAGMLTHDVPRIGGIKR